MKPLYYATKLDKHGNKITLTYATTANRERYSEGAKYTDGLIFVDINSDGKMARFDASLGEVKGSLLRAMIVNNGEVEDLSESGFVIYGKKDGRWAKTPFVFGTYSEANTAMKNMVKAWQALMILDETKEKPAKKLNRVDFSDLSMDDE